MNARELRAQRAQYLDDAKNLVIAAEAEDRDLKPEEQTQYDKLVEDAKAMEARIARQENISNILDSSKAPVVLKFGRGDNESRAMAAYIRHGDLGAIRGMRGEDEGGNATMEVRIPTGLEMRAVDSTMNITTDADGKYTVPTGFSGQVATRRNEIRLAEKLGVRQVPGVGTTVNFPYENAEPVVFATTVESVDGHTTVYERDAPVFGIKAFTLVKKTKKIEITEELFEDTDVNLMAYIADLIGRDMGLTHNTAMLVEAAASGTSVALGAAAAMTAGDPEKFAYHATLGYYLDDGASAAWVMRPPTFGAIKNLTGTSRLYGEQAPGSLGRQLMEYPVHYSNAAAAIAASAKSVYFGNWYYMGLREGPSLTILRDPYSVDGITLIKYGFRLCYGVLIAGGIAYGAHPSA